MDKNRDNLCPFCMREMDTPKDESTDQEGFTSAIAGLEQIIYALGCVKVLFEAMKVRYTDDEGESHE